MEDKNIDILQQIEIENILETERRKTKILWDNFILRREIFYMDLVTNYMQEKLK